VTATGCHQVQSELLLEEEEKALTPPWESTGADPYPSYSDSYGYSYSDSYSEEEEEEEEKGLTPPWESTGMDPEPSCAMPPLK